MLVPLRIPVSFTTDATGAGSVPIIPTQAYNSSMTFVGSIGGAAPAWVISGGGLPLAVGQGNYFMAGPMICYPGEQITISVTGATPATTVSGTMTGQFSTVSASELPTQPLTVNGVTNAQSGGLQRLGFEVFAQDNTLNNIIPGASPGLAVITLYALVWHFVPVNNANLNTPPPVGYYFVTFQGAGSPGGQFIEGAGYNVVTAVGGMASPTRDLELWNHPEKCIPGAGFGMTMRTPAIGSVPTAGVGVVGHVIYTQQ